MVDPHRLWRARWIVRGTVWWFIFPVFAGSALIIALIVFGRQLGLLAWPFAAASAIFGLWAWHLFWSDGAERSLLRAMVASIFLAFAAYGVLMPSFTAAFPSPAITQVLRESGCKQPLLAAAGFHEPSLVFYAGTETKLVDGSAAADFLRSGDCRFAAVEARHERSFLRRAESIGLRYSAPQRIDGYNYSIGRAISIAIYQSEGGS